MSKQTIRNLGRRLLIVLLLVTALLLLRETGYYSGLRDKLLSGRREYPETAASTEIAQPGQTAGTAQPLAAVVCGTEGTRFGAAYDEESVTAVFWRFSAMFGEALGSAGVPEPVEETQFLNDLNCCGVFLRFYCPQPLELLSAWLGTEVSGAAAGYSAKTLYLCAEDGAAKLYFRTDEPVCYCCSTEVSPDALRSRTEEYSDNGACFAAENADIIGGDAFAVILRSVRSSRQVKYAVPKYSSEETDALLQALGMNRFVTSSYTEADGTTVFVNDESTVRVSPSGSLLFRRDTGYDNPGSKSLCETVSLAWQTAERSVGANCGDGSLLFADVRRNESQRSITVMLDYAVSGVPVQLPSGHAAEIVLRGDQVIQAKLQLCRFSLGEEETPLLPDLQAAAVAAAENAEAELRYVMGGETMNCIWVKSDG